MECETWWAKGREKTSMCSDVETSNSSRIFYVVMYLIDIYNKIDKSIMKTASRFFKTEKEINVNYENEISNESRNNFN